MTFNAGNEMSKKKKKKNRVKAEPAPKFKSRYLNNPATPPNALEREWWRALIHRNKLAAIAANELERKKAQAQRFNGAPKDQYFSPSRKIMISREGYDRGSIDQPLDQHVMEVEGSVQLVNRTRDLLDRLYKAHEINEASYKAGKEFKRCFSAAGYDRVKTSNLTGVGGGYGLTAAEQIEQTAEARGTVHSAVEIVGGYNSPMWKAMFWLVGMEKSLNQVSEAEGGSRDVWTGFAKSALYLLGREYERSPKNRAR